MKPIKIVCFNFLIPFAVHDGSEVKEVGLYMLIRHPLTILKLCKHFIN